MSYWPITDILVLEYMSSILAKKNTLIVKKTMQRKIVGVNNEDQNTNLGVFVTYDDKNSS